MPHYDVIVGNIGYAMQTFSRAVADRSFDIYVEQSKTNYGRASGEDVTLMQDGEPIREYFGTLRSCDACGNTLDGCCCPFLPTD
jgi:hypothetical protein